MSFGQVFLIVVFMVVTNIRLYKIEKKLNETPKSDK